MGATSGPYTSPGPTTGPYSGTAALRAAELAQTASGPAAVGDVVTTLEQLEALPTGTVIVLDSVQFARAVGPVVWQKWDVRGHGEVWVSPSYTDPAPSRGLILRPYGPDRYRVVWRPEPIR